MSSEVKKKLKVAVVGYGHLGKWHCEKVSESLKADLKVIVDPLLTSREKASAGHPKVKVLSQLDELKNLDIDAAIVVVPTSFHFEVVEYFLERGIAVFCEKPLVSRLSDAYRLKDLMDKKGGTLQVGHSERFHKVWEKREDFEGFLEGPAIIRLDRLAVSKGRAKDVDVVQDLMIHDLDLINYLLDEKPVALRAWGCKIVDDKWDSVTAQLRFSSGKVVFLSSARHYVEEKRFLSSTNSRGSLLVDLLNHKLKVSESSDEGYGEFVVRDENYDKRDHLKLEQELFYSSILEEKPIAVGLEEGLYAVKLVDRVLESLASNKEINI